MPQQKWHLASNSWQKLDLLFQCILGLNHLCNMMDQPMMYRHVTAKPFYQENTFHYQASRYEYKTRKLLFLFLNQNICCGYSKEPSLWYGSFERPKHMFKLMGKKIIPILGLIFLLNWPHALFVDSLRFQKLVHFCLVKQNISLFVLTYPKLTLFVQFFSASKYRTRKTLIRISFQSQWLCLWSCLPVYVLVEK